MKMKLTEMLLPLELLLLLLLPLVLLPFLFFLSIEFETIFYDFWIILRGFGMSWPSKNHEKLSNTAKKWILGCVLDTSFFEGGFWEGLERLLGGFKWILECLLVEFSRVLEELLLDLCGIIG